MHLNISQRLRVVFIGLLVFNGWLLDGQRYDFNWVIGYAGGQGDTRWGTNFIDFNSGNPIVSYQDKGRMYIYEANSSISDIDGRLLYFTNGYDIEDINFKKIQGGTNLGTRYWDGLVCHQGALFINGPGYDSTYYLFYLNKLHSDPGFFIEDLKYLKINNISNKVIEKDTVVHDTLNEGCLTSCKHANGRDWWLVLNKWNSNIFYKYLLTKAGLKYLGKQELGSIIIDGLGQAVFSNNGKYLVLYESISNFQGAYFYLYRFNRCNGELVEIQNKHIDKMGFGGISFSPNSKYFYHSSGLVLNQTDIEQINPLDNFEQIDIITEQTPWGSQYNMHQLGPDGRIYISNAYSNFVMHRINKPNKKGKLALPISNSFALKTLGGRGIPNMPNYRLGPIDGSSCDTLGIDNIPWAWWRHDQDTIDYLNIEFSDLSAYEVTEWEWTFGDGTKSTEQNPIHKYAKDGIYEVCLIAKNKNGSDTLCKTLNLGTTSIDQIDQAIKLEVFPNPTSEFFYINVLEYLPEHMKLRMYNLQGELIKEQRLFPGSNVIGVEGFSSGMYVLEVLERNIVIKTEKLIVVK